jgi:hypothetical protein
MSEMRIDDPQRRDRLLLLNAFAILLLTLLGTAGESLGNGPPTLRTSTAKRRVHSLFRQGWRSMNSFPTCQNRDCGP